MAISANVSNRLGFWILGLTNNFAYVIMLSAAFDLLKHLPNEPIPALIPALNGTVSLDPAGLEKKDEPFCNPIPTSAILLADTIPSLVTKIVYPFLFGDWPMYIRVIGVITLSASAFLLTGLFTTKFLIFFGVVCASFSSGLGESTYLSSTPKYSDGSLSAWSSGTGAAGLFGALFYAVMTMFLSIRTIMFIMLLIPCAMGYAYRFLLSEVDSPNDSNREGMSVVNNSNKTKFKHASYSSTSVEVPSAITDTPPAPRAGDIGTRATMTRVLSIDEKLRLLPGLLKYFLPLTIVYYSEYFINQGLFELVYFPEITWLAHPAQYRWFQVCYQLGVMISRSSLDLVRIKQIGLMSFLQTMNLFIFLAHAIRWISLPNFYITLIIIVYEGLLGGFAYINTFHRVTTEIRPEFRQFSLSAVVLADSLGIVAAGFSAIPVHNAICNAFYSNPSR